MDLIVGVNSYISLDDANNYVKQLRMSTDKGRKKWEQLSDEDKAVLINKYTIEVDNLPYFGKRVSTEQSLGFPRIISGRYIECPYQVRICIVELSLLELEYDSTDANEHVKLGIETYKIKDASVTYREDAGNILSGKVMDAKRKWLNNFVKVCL